MPAIEITKKHLENIVYDAAPAASKAMPDPSTVTTPTVLIVGDKGDLNAAAYHLSKSLETPYSVDAIATVLVAESVRTKFIACLQSQLKPNAPEVAKVVQRQQALQLIAQHKWETIVAPTLGDNSPTIVCDVTHEHLGSAGYTGIITLHTFRTVPEAISLCGKESLKFVNVSIWHENHSCAYEIALKINCVNCFVNCHQVSLVPLEQAATGGVSCALVEQNYHYETLTLKGGNRNIVFPIGTIITN